MPQLPTIDFLSAFDASGAPAPVVQPIVAAQPTQSVLFDASNPHAVQGMNLVRSQMAGDVASANQRAAEASARADATATQLRSLQTPPVPQAQVPDYARIEAQLAQSEARSAEREAQLIATVTESNNRIQAWQVQAELEKIKSTTGGELEIHLLNTTSIEALHASIPLAQQEYQNRKQRMFAEFQQAYNVAPASANQTIVEGLAAGPAVSGGFPTPSNAITPVQAPQNQIPQFTHPQLDGGQSYGQAQQMAHGVVQQMAPGQGYQQMQYAQQGSPVMQPQHQPMLGAPHPQNIQQWAMAQQAQAQAQSRQQMQPQMMPGAQMSPQMQMSAPLPDAAGSTNGAGIRPLSAHESHAAAEGAQAVVARHRSGQQPHVVDQHGMSLSGMVGGGLPSHPAIGATHMSVPLPQVGAAFSHPMNRTSPGG